jgi:crotonobetainyl-CoA:carnitine CoA-transferase CaiB-like acyl-CoA transferase
LSKQEGAPSPYRVLDLADSQGAYCTKLFADLGADVVKVEAPQGDSRRRMPPFAGDVPHPQKSLYFLHRKAGKGGITLDFETPDGRDILIGLAARADILVQNRPLDHAAYLDSQH